MTSTAGIVVRAALVLAVPACASRETAEQRVTRLRNNYRVEPAGFQMRTTAGGSPELLVRLLVVNQGGEGLRTLTILAHLQAPDGTDRLSLHVPVDVSGLAPGVTGQRVAVIPGAELRDGENLFVELEAAPPREARIDYPEYRPHGGGAP